MVNKDIKLSALPPVFCLCSSSELMDFTSGQGGLDKDVRGTRLEKKQCMLFMFLRQITFTLYFVSAVTIPGWTAD
jgi:hypothetical protein